MRGLHYIEADLDDWISEALDWDSLARWLEVWS